LLIWKRVCTRPFTAWRIKSSPPLLGALPGGIGYIHRRVVTALELGVKFWSEVLHGFFLAIRFGVL